LNIIRALKKKERELLREVGKIQSAIELLGGKKPTKRKMSAAARKRISMAQKKRWREARKG
jgi:hypothetical protein